MSGMFGAIGVQSALFENNVLLVAQHMMQYAVTGWPAAPMPSCISAWGLYDVFTADEGEQIFRAAVSDTRWALLCWPATTPGCRRAIG
jgi:crotonobetainyl-CoA:carnitine CoA-transferase CaiB-like acyl-CoA transferase